MSYRRVIKPGDLDTHQSAMNDDYLDDIFASLPKPDPKGPVFKAPKFNGPGAKDAALQDGYVTLPKGSGTFYARNAFKQMRGYFDPDTKTWRVPKEHVEAAMQAITAANERSADLTAQDVAELLNTTPGNVPASDIATCWECGGPLKEWMTRMGTRALHLKAGAIEAEDYCGCVERGDSKRRHRPDFRGTAGRRW